MPDPRAPLRAKTPSVAPKEWTVMIFMVLDGAIEAMQRTAESDLDEMRAAGSSTERNIVVEKHVLGSRFSIEPKSNAKPAKITHYEVNLDERFGAVPTLRQFLLETLEWFPAEHYALILWGHSFELGFGGLSSPGNTLDLTELADALGAFKRKRPGCKSLEILGTSSCSYSTTEAVVGLAGLVNFMVASESTIPFTSGWPFQIALESFRNGNAPKDICRRIVREFVNATPELPVSLTAVDVGMSKGLSDFVTELASAILGGANDVVFQQSLVLAFLEAIMNLLPEPSKKAHQGWVPAVDLFDFAHELSKSTTIALTSNVAEKVRDVAKKAKEVRTALVIANKAAAPDPSMHGLLLLAPGTGAKILEIIKREMPTSDDVIRLVDQFASVEKSFIEHTHPGYPENWKQTNWPLVLELISNSLDTMLEATPVTEAGKNWCNTCKEAGRRAMTVLTSGGTPV